MFFFGMTERERGRGCASDHVRCSLPGRGALGLVCCHWVPHVTCILCCIAVWCVWRQMAGGTIFSCFLLPCCALYGNSVVGIAFFQSLVVFPLLGVHLKGIELWHASTTPHPTHVSLTLYPSHLPVWAPRSVHPNDIQATSVQLFSGIVLCFLICAGRAIICLECASVHGNMPVYLENGIEQ